MAVAVHVGVDRDVRAQKCHLKRKKTVHHVHATHTHTHTHTFNCQQGHLPEENQRSIQDNRVNRDTYLKGIKGISGTTVNRDTYLRGIKQASETTGSTSIPERNQTGI